MKSRDELRAMGGHFIIWSGDSVRPLLVRRIPTFDEPCVWEFWRWVGVVDGKGDVYEECMLPEGANDAAALPASDPGDVGVRAPTGGFDGG
jgi:hypothetical protein